jgi:hypothetical protein
MPHKHSPDSVWSRKKLARRRLRELASALADRLRVYDNLIGEVSLADDGTVLFGPRHQDPIVREILLLKAELGVEDERELMPLIRKRARAR